jgi:predicted aspartyl protease
LYAANHTKISSLGEAEIKLVVQGKIIGAKVVVSDEVDSVILGSDFLRGHNAVWNFSTAKITLDGFVFDLCGRPKTGFVRRIYVDTDVLLPARH